MIPADDLLALLLLVVGLSLGSIGVGLSRLRAARRRRRWREADAEIVWCDLDESPAGDFRVEYRYVVDGRDYLNDHIVPGRDAVPGPEGEELFRQYPVHRHTTVFYDPDDPAQSALEVGTDDLVQRPIVLGALGLAGCAALAGALLLLGWL